MAEVEEAPIGQRVAELENTVGWLTARSYRQEERVDRVYAQQWVFTINSVALEEVWTGLGDGATPQAAAAAGGDKWLEEVTG